ncbi:MAG: Cysteine desulfurase [Candidatus Falkowbacteria bacterium GW2011_GWF2_39_8]|uniref:Cysteine desulfurase n=1 Tax=Candidatus Falkowbacteria bacterium GW2011_GWF2_39_8 TaxID=1618642 RepID=A0A0G0T4G1_9BACT|nr:MAG: Cysteine desulfurase [Candidatus Falkowbacteria bacterium GW2011_GWF2_39_8]
MKKIYFDHSATTPVDKDVSKNFGNPSSIHSFGQKAMTGVDQARAQAAKFLNCKPDEIVFTSGSTEANNLAINGVVKAINKRNKAAKKLHIITSVIEHDSVLEPIAGLEREGFEVTHLSVKSNGVIDPEEFKKAIKENTVLVSIMYVNSEVGSIQPIREIGKIIKKINDNKLKTWQNREPNERGDKPELIYFHTDATQAANFLSCDT